jgi:hypothetical protein
VDEDDSAQASVPADAHLAVLFFPFAFFAFLCGYSFLSRSNNLLVAAQQTR